MSTISAAADRLINEGNRAERAGQLREACALYLQAVGAAPDYGKAHLNLAIALEALGDGEAALASYEAALANDPADPYANYNLGRLRYNRGELRRGGGAPFPRRGAPPRLPRPR